MLIGGYYISIWLHSNYSTDLMWCLCDSLFVITPLTAAGSAAIRSGAKLLERTQNRCCWPRGSVPLPRRSRWHLIDTARIELTYLKKTQKSIRRAIMVTGEVLDVQGSNQPLDP